MRDEGDEAAPNSEAIASRRLSILGVVSVATGLLSICAVVASLANGLELGRNTTFWTDESDERVAGGAALACMLGLAAAIAGFRSPRRAKLAPLIGMIVNGPLALVWAALAYVLVSL